MLNAKRSLNVKLVGAFSVITNLLMDLRFKLYQQPPALPSQLVRQWQLEFSFQICEDQKQYVQRT